MAGDVNPIYQRLNSVQDYHPFKANTFADWSLEAGDIVSINRGGTSYSGPTQMNTIKWTGQQQVTVEVPGEQTRGSVARMSAETYNGGNGGGNGYRSGYRRNTKEELIGAKIRENADNILLEAWNREQADNTFEASLKVQADSITAEVKNRRKGDEELSGRIKVAADKIDIIVESTADGKPRVKPAAITAAITNSNGYLTSDIKISASNVIIDGNTSINDVFSIRGQQIHFLRPVYFISSGHATAIGSAGISTGYVMVNARQLRVANISIDGSVMTVSYVDGTSKTFKKATSLSGRWSGSTGTVATFEYQTDDTSIPTESTYLVLRQSGSYVVAYDPSGAPRARVSAGSSYSHNSVIEYDHYDDEEELYYYRSEDLITRKSVGAGKTVYYN